MKQREKILKEIEKREKAVHKKLGFDPTKDVECINEGNNDEAYWNGDIDIHRAKLSGYDIAIKEVCEKMDFGLNGEQLAKFMHDEYEKIAKEIGWNTQDSCKVEYEDLPKKNKEVMNVVAVNVMWKLKEKLKDAIKGKLKARKDPQS